MLRLCGPARRNKVALTLVLFVILWGFGTITSQILRPVIAQGTSSVTSVQDIGGKRFGPGQYFLLLDSTPAEIVRASITIELNCDDQKVSDFDLAYGNMASENEGGAQFAIIDLNSSNNVADEFLLPGGLAISEDICIYRLEIRPSSEVPTIDFLALVNSDKDLPVTASDVSVAIVRADLSDLE
jgi:hypothetical protein